MRLGPSGGLMRGEMVLSVFVEVGVCIRHKHTMSIATIYWEYTNNIERTALLKTMIYTYSMQLSKQ